MEGDTIPWADWFNFDAGSDAQPWGYDGNQGDLGAERLEFGTPDLGFGPLSLDQSWPLNDSIAPTHPFIRCLSPSMFSSNDLSGQQHVQQTSLSGSASYAEPVPQPYDVHGFLMNEGVQEDIAGTEHPIVESCLMRHKSEEENRDQLYLGPNHKCSCMNCLLLGTNQKGLPIKSLVKDASGYFLACRFPGCQKQIKGGYYFPPDAEFIRHERAHFLQFECYHCAEQGCKTTTTTWADLRRHCLNRHCTTATKFPCPILGCKYGGDNGFTREDKLKSHHRNVHRGKVVPGKAFQPIKPKANGAKLIKGKAQAVQTIKPKPSAGA